MARRNDFIKKLSKLKECFGKEKTNMEIKALTKLKAFMNERIFDRSLAADETTSLGDYINIPYGRKRKKAGLKIRVKNLQFTKEFKNDMQVGKKEGKNVLGFSTDRSADIVEGQEDQLSLVIFQQSEEEINIIIDEDIKPFWQKIVNECLAK